MRVHIWARASPVPHPEMSFCSCSLTGYFEGELLNDRVKFFNECRRSLLTIVGPILSGVRNLLNSKKGRLRSLRQPATKRMRILKTGEPEMKALFIGWKLVMTTFLLCNIQITAGPLEVYLQNVKSLGSLWNLPVFEVEGFEAFEICRFLERCLREYVFDFCKVCKSQKRQKNAPKEYTLTEVTKVYLFFKTFE